MAMTHSTPHSHLFPPGRRLRREAVRGLAAGLGLAVDITEVDGAGVSVANAAALELSLALLTAEGPLRHDEFGSPWPELARFAGGFADDDHTHHLHVAWTAE